MVPLSASLYLPSNTHNIFLEIRTKKTEQNTKKSNTKGLPCQRARICPQRNQLELRLSSNGNDPVSNVDDDDGVGVGDGDDDDKLNLPFQSVVKILKFFFLFFKC